MNSLIESILEGKDPKEAIKHALAPSEEPMLEPDQRDLDSLHNLGLKQVVPPKIEDMITFDSLLKSMSQMTAGARTVGQAADVIEAMFRDEDCKVVLTLSGNASVSKFDHLYAKLLDQKLIDIVVTTGAVVTHSFSTERGKFQLRIDDPSVVDDTFLYNRGGNRIYDVVEPETSLVDNAKILLEWLSHCTPNVPICSADVCRAIGNYLLDNHTEQDGLLHAAARNDVSIIIPSFSDSETGLEFAKNNIMRKKEDKDPLIFDAFEDWSSYCEFAKDAKSLGIITLGGGVPRNWAQQVGPFYDILVSDDLEDKDTVIKFKYGVRICNDSVHIGGLSGCTYSEGRSWGKFITPDAGGQYAEVISDYTVVFPLLIQGVLERLNG